MPSPNEMEQIGADMRATLERMRPSEDSFLPAQAVELQRWLALFSDDELYHLLIGGSVALASRTDATTPSDIARSLLEPLGKIGAGMNWPDRLLPEVRRLADEARAGREPAEPAP